LYNIRPGNGVSLFLQPRSPHEADGANLLVLNKTLGNISSHIEDGGTPT